MRRWLQALVLTPFLVIGLAGPASAQTLTSDQNSYTPGETGSADGNDLAADTRYDLQFIQGSSTRTLDTRRTDGDGDVDFDFTIPSSATAGSAMLRASPRSGTVSASKTITISAATTPTPTATPTARPTATPDDDDSATDNTPSPRTGGARLNVLGDDEFRAGESGKATAVAVTPNENYVLDFAQSPGTVIARATANRHGTVRFEFRIPSSARLGRATLTALPADGSGLRAFAPITIVSGSGGSGGGGGRSLPATGRDVLLSALIAVLLLLGGLVMQRFEWLRR